MTTYLDPFSGATINPSQVGYEYLSISANTQLQWPINGNNANVVANIIDVTASTTGLLVLMPSALQVSTGQAFIIRNVGTNTFTVTDQSGNTIIALTSGLAEYVWVTDNTTANGTWATVTFGAGTSSANASSLAGYGLTAIGTTLNQQYLYSAQYSGRTLTSADRASFLVWDGGVGTITLPSSGSIPAGWFVNIRNNGTGILTVAAQGADTLDGSSSQQLQIGNSFTVVASGSPTFNSFGKGQNIQFVYTILSKVVTSGTYTLTNLEAANLIQEYSGTLTGNVTVVLPSTVQQYSLTNMTTGSYTLTFKTAASGAQTVTLAQNTSGIVICDGTNVFSATSASFSNLPSITLNNGTYSAPTLNFLGDTTTGLYLSATGTLGLAAGGTVGATLSSSGLYVPGGIAGGAF